MPAKSRSQWRKMHVLFERGEITRAELNSFTQGVNFNKLPVRKPKKGARKKPKRR